MHRHRHTNFCGTECASETNWERRQMLLLLSIEQKGILVILLWFLPLWWWWWWWWWWASWCSLIEREQNGTILSPKNRGEWEKAANALMINWHSFHLVQQNTKRLHFRADQNDPPDDQGQLRRHGLSSPLKMLRVTLKGTRTQMTVSLLHFRCCKCTLFYCSRVWKDNGATVSSTENMAAASFYVHTNRDRRPRDIDHFHLFPLRQWRTDWQTNWLSSVRCPLMDIFIQCVG